MTAARRGNAARLAGVAAEEVAARWYEARGGVIEARNWRARREDGGGEIDLVVRRSDALIFVEVKAGRSARRRDVIRESQWLRLEKAALRYIVECETGDPVDLRFDAAFVGPDGVVSVVENARGMD